MSGLFERIREMRSGAGPVALGSAEMYDAEHNAMGPILDALTECRGRLVSIETALDGQRFRPLVEARRAASIGLMHLSKLDASQADTTGTVE